MTVDERLREAHARIPGPDEVTVARARARLAAVTGEPIRKRRRPLRLALPVGALALAAAAVIALLANGDEVAVERPAAGKSPNDPATLLAGGKVFYQRGTFHVSTKYIGADRRPTATPGDAVYAIARSAPEETWLAPDGSGRILYGADSPTYLPSPADERAWSVAGKPDLEQLMGVPGEWGPKKQDFGPGELDKSMIFNSNLEAVLPKDDPLSVVPHDPAELAAFLETAAAKQRQGAPKNVVDATFDDDALTFLRYPRTPDDLRAALIDVLSARPGTRQLGELRDAAGRTATAIELASGGGRVVAYDPTTARLMGTGTKVADGVRWDMTYGIVTAGVPEIGDRP
jgi:hypothetical protein